MYSQISSQISSLYELSTEASLNDIHILKHHAKSIPKLVLYDLVKKCFTGKNKRLAFQVLIQNWPLNIFAVQEIGIKLSEEDVLLIASLVQTGHIGSIKHLDLVHKDFVCLDSRASDAFLSVLTNQDPLLDTGKYAPSNVSFSYSEAVQYAQKYVYHGENNSMINGKSILINQARNRSTHLQPYKDLTVYIEIVVNVTNYHKVMDVLSTQNLQNIEKPFIRLSAVQLAFEYVPAQKIVKVLEVANCDEVRGIDLSFNSLSSLDRLEMVSEALQRFHNMENVCFAYNSIDATESRALINCLKMLPNLGRLDLSWNRLGKSLADLFTSEWKAMNLYELVLTGCDVTRTVLNAFSECHNLSNLCKLRLDQNNLSGGRRKAALIRALERLESSLRYLDLSCCGFSKEDIFHICSVFGNFNDLNHLIVFPNSGISPEIIRLEVLPLLTTLPNLKSLPPIADLQALNADNSSA